MNRREIERILLAEAVDRGNLDFLKEKGITPEHFSVYREIAKDLFSKADDYIPSRVSCEKKSTPQEGERKPQWDIAPESWEPSPENVPEALYEMHQIHAEDLFNRELFNLRSTLNEKEGWKKALNNLLTRFAEIQTLLDGGTADYESDRHHFIDIGSFFENGLEPQEHLIRGILLKGKSHLFFGPRENGKSWIVKWCAKELLSQGKKVLFIDFESNHHTFTDRFINRLGVSPKDSSTLLRYALNPEYDSSPEAKRDFNKIVDEFNPDLIIWDAWSGALGACGLKESDNDHIIEWSAQYLKYLMSKNITTIIVDHTGHEDQNRPRNASRKEQEVDVSWQIKCTEEFDKKTVGRVLLKRSKDRHSELPKRVEFEIGGSPFVCDPIDALDDYDLHLNPNARKIRRYIENNPHKARFNDFLNVLGKWEDGRFSPGSKGSVHNSLTELSELDLIAQNDDKTYYPLNPLNQKNPLFKPKSPSRFSGSAEVQSKTEPVVSSEVQSGGSIRPPTEPKTELSSRGNKNNSGILLENDVDNPREDIDNPLENNEFSSSLSPQTPSLYEKKESDNVNGGCQWEHCGEPATVRVTGEGVANGLYCDECASWLEGGEISITPLQSEEKTNAR